MAQNTRGVIIMAILYQISDWDLHFENNKSRERDSKTWCSIPNKQDGLGYGRLMQERDGASLYGAFIAVALVASKQRRPRNGHLTDTGRADGCPYDAQALAIKTRMPVALIARMLTFMVEITGWITTSETDAQGVPAECPPSARVVPVEKRREEKRREDKKDISSDEFDVWYTIYFRKEKKQDALLAWGKLNDQDKTKALQVVGPWCIWKKHTTDPKYWPLPASWLNGKRFDDEILPVNLVSGSVCTKCLVHPPAGGSQFCSGCLEGILAESRRLGVEVE